MTHYGATLVGRLAGLEPGTAIAEAFRARSEARRFAEDSYRRLLEPQHPGPMSVLERRAVAAFVAVLTGEEQTRQHLLSLLRATDPVEGPRLATLIEREAEASAHPGPYGRFPAGPLTAEDLDGPVYTVILSKPSPARYHTTNWSSYTACLRRRGSLLIWLDKEMTWLAPHDGSPGRPAVFSE